MKLFADGKVYPLQGFCTETSNFVEVAETCTSLFKVLLSRKYMHDRPERRLSEEIF